MKYGAKFPHGLADELIERIGTDQKIVHAPVQADILERHLRVALDAKELTPERTVFGGILVELQAHHGNGRFDAVHPAGVIVERVGTRVVVFRDEIV